LPAKLINLLGQEFGLLTVYSWAGFKLFDTGTKRHYWACKCVCGNEVVKCGNYLTRYKYASCGCYTPPSTIRNLENTIYTSYKYNAIKRGYSFELTLDQFRELLYKDCYYCGSNPVNKCAKGKKHIYYNGVDRQNNSLGYSLSNVVPCCGRCNVSKMDSSAEDFIERCKLIASRF
jgi:hypothetical protein